MLFLFYTDKYLMPTQRGGMKYSAVIDHEECESAGADLIFRWFN